MELGACRVGPMGNLHPTFHASLSASSSELPASLNVKSPSRFV